MFINLVGFSMENVLQLATTLNNNPNTVYDKSFVSQNIAYKNRSI